MTTATLETDAAKDILLEGRSRLETGPAAKQPTEIV
jgi:hypothetical protein